jgi:DNA repair protein RecN (Recombination protein N)
MLRLLRIRNLAVIEAVEVEFEPGFNVLTGETGAGKSILVEAVGLLLGGRASADLVRTGEPQATIEALFDDSLHGEVIVRREVTSQGRSRSFVNGALVTTAALRELSDRLVELHGQHEHQLLLDPASHLPLLDESAGLGALSDRVAAAWSTVRELREQRDRARMDAREKAARMDLIDFQLHEIEKAGPRPGEDEGLATTRQVLANAERILRLCEEAYTSLYEGEHAALSSLSQVWKRVGELAALDPQFTSHLEARDAIKGQLEDLAFLLRGYADGVDASPGRLQEVEDRLALLERLKRKYGPSLDDVISRAAALTGERDQLSRAGEAAADIEASLAQASRAYLTLAEELSAKRRAGAGPFATQVERQLGRLAMTRSRFEVRFRQGTPAEDGWTEHGIDQAEFFVSPNPGEDLRPLARIASGGELSRLMLALRTMSVGDGAGRTLVFDEVDAGIGGQAAEVVGAMLRQLGRRFQVLCITHLPQIASQAESHYRIEKSVRGSRTVTAVQRLEPTGRIEEIGRMISGRQVTEPVRASAREMLGLTAKGKQKAKGESESPQ